MVCLGVVRKKHPGAGQQVLTQALLYAGKVGQQHVWALLRALSLLSGCREHQAHKHSAGALLQEAQAQGGQNAAHPSCRDSATDEACRAAIMGEAL